MLIKWFKKKMKLKTDFKTLLLDNTNNMNVIGLNFLKETTFCTMLKFAAVVLVFVIHSYGNIRGILYLNLPISKIIVNICHLAGIFMIGCRYLHIVFSTDSFRDLVHHAIASTTKYDLSKDLEIELEAKFSRTARLIQVVLYIVYRFIVATNATLPIFFIKWYMLAPISIPGIDIYSHPGYEIILLFTALLYYYLYLAFHVYDSFFFFFAFIVSMRSDLFCELASQIGDYKSEYNTAKKQKKLIFQLYGLHRDITNFSKKFATTFSVFALQSGFVSLFCLTIAMYLRNADPLYSCTLIGVTTTQFMLFCIFGEMILQRNKKMATEIYCSKWYNITDIQDRKMVALFLMQSQFNTRLSAYGIYDLSMETFSKFVQKAYSFYALLRNMS